MTAISSRIEQVIRRGLAAHLKEEGYRRSGRTFRLLADTVRVVSVQGSQWNSEESGRFTVNLGVYFPQLVTLIGGEPVRSPREYDCPVRARIAELRAGRDDWWELGEATDLDELSSNVLRAYVEHARPWLDSNADPRSLLESGGASVLAAAAAVTLGDRDGARSLLSRTIVSNPGERDLARRCVDRWQLR